MPDIHKKGSRNPLIGYKPQLGRSENGFVSSLIVPQGNAADSTELVPAVRDSIKRTHVIAGLVSTDDGYASAEGRDELLAMGVKKVSISGDTGLSEEGVLSTAQAGNYVSK